MMEKAMLKPDAHFKTGEILVKEGLVRQEDVDMALSMQKQHQNTPGPRKNRLLGMILCDLNLITPQDNYYILNKYQKLLTLESALVTKGLFTSDGIRKEIDASKKQDIPFISHLLKTGQVSTRKMQNMLFGLFHIPFRSIADFIFNEKDRTELTRIMDRQRSADQHIIPLVIKENTVLFGITRPDNILVIRQLNEQFPQFRFKTLFIPFSGFAWFSKIIYQGTHENKAPKNEPVDLSLLLNFKTVIKEPEFEKKAVWILYERYELLRRLIGRNRRGNFQDEFNLFIQKTHQQICSEYKVDHVEYSLKKEGGNVSVVAFPVRQEEG